MSYEFKAGYARANISSEEPCPVSGLIFGRNRISKWAIDMWPQVLREFYKNS